MDVICRYRRNDLDCPVARYPRSITGKVNYAPYLPAYYAQMAYFLTRHPGVFQPFLDGHFSYPFGRILVDQTTEVNVNKDTQTPGGTRMFSLKSGAVKRLYVISEHRSIFLGQMREMVKGNNTYVRHVDPQETRI